MIGARFLDRDSDGIVYLVEPWILKEPMPIRVKYNGREEIVTKAGRFKTIKGTMLIADVFIGRLLESYTKNMTVWVVRTLAVSCVTPNTDPNRQP